MNVTTPPLHIVGACIRIYALGRLKPLITVRDRDIVVSFSLSHELIGVSYDTLMKIPEFRAGVLAVLAQETARQI